MGDIIPARTAIETFRDSGYKSTAAAISELIDNSIEANARNVQIITFEQQVTNARRTSYQIQEIAIYDDGTGMPKNVLDICLQFGNGTRLKSREGIGRFGIGLPNASVSQAKRVEVYSWSNGKCFHTYLDVDEIKEKNLSQVNDVVESTMPQKYLNEVEGGVADSGTLIIWKKCDRLDISFSRTLISDMSKDLCRVYRHFLDDDDTYGERISLKIISTGKERKIHELGANDPLYLMTPNNTPGHEDKSTNVMHGDVIKLMVDIDHEGTKAKIEMRMSIALPETQSAGGGSQLGKHYGENVGISIIRAAREIDFKTFRFFNSKDERERWWGCEIRFEPVLDELFGVTNNKQSVRGINFLDVKEFKKAHPEDADELLDSDLKLKLRAALSNAFSSNHKQMMGVIRNRGAGTRGDTPKERAASDKSTKIANKQLENSIEDTRSKLDSDGKSTDEMAVEWRDRLEKSDTTLNDNDAIEIASEKVGLKIEKDFSGWPGNQFFTTEITGQTCVVVINIKHPFYSELYEPLLQSNDSRHIEAMDLLIMSYARVEDEMYSYEDELESIKEKWGGHLKKFLKELEIHT
jgi:hypothetical protein